MTCLWCEKNKLCQQHASLKYHHDIYQGLKGKEIIALYKERCRKAFGVEK